MVVVNHLKRGVYADAVRRAGIRCGDVIWNNIPCLVPALLILGFLFGKGLSFLSTLSLCNTTKALPSASNVTQPLPPVAVKKIADAEV